jgi:hypothetical protein
MATDREADAKVAELVMGFTRTPVRVKGSTNYGDCWLQPDAPEIDGQWTAHELHVYYAPRFYTTDPAADYQVLAHVREKWGAEHHCAMRDELKMAWERRAHDSDKAEVWGPTQYRPGDYSRAALAVIEKEQANAK